MDSRIKIILLALLAAILTNEVSSESYNTKMENIMKNFTKKAKIVTDEIYENVEPIIEITTESNLKLQKQPVKLNLKQGLTMNQILDVYSLKDSTNDLCKNHSIEFTRAMRAFEPWALKMFDSSSKIQSGILYGNLFEFGSYKQCISIYSESEYGPIRGKHCTLRLHPDEFLLKKILSYRNVSEKRWDKVRVFVENATLDWSICVPDSCQVDDVLPHFEKLIRSLTEGLNIAVGLRETNCLTAADIKSFTHIELMIIGGLIVYVIVVAVFTLMDFYSTQDEVENNALMKIFSARRNTKNIFTKGKGSSDLDCVHGIRFMSTCYVIIGHRYLMMMFFPVINSLHIMEELLQQLLQIRYNKVLRFFGIQYLKTQQLRGFIEVLKEHTLKNWKIEDRKTIRTFYILRMSKDKSIMNILAKWILLVRSTAITGGTLCVDSFFMISGMLVSLGFFEETSKRKMNWFMFYFHRYMRITPPLAIVVLWYCTLMQHFGSGPLWNDMLEVIQKPCQDYWWATIMHIQNYVHPYPLCLTQAWYLTCDMQYYFLSPIILIPLTKNTTLGYANLILMYCISLFVNFYIAWINKYNGGVPVTNQLFSTKYFQYHYIAPHTRASTYIIGLGFGLVIFKQKRSRIQIGNAPAVAGWLICIATMLASLVGCLVFFRENHDYNRIESTIFISISRSTWTLGIVWMVWACINGYGGPINWVLSLHVFRVLGKISYGMYLLHMGMQYMISGAAKTPGYFSDFGSISAALSDLVIMVIAGYIFTILFEAPLVQTLAFLDKRGKIRKPTVKVQPMEKF